MVAPLLSSYPRVAVLLLLAVWTAAHSMICTVSSLSVVPANVCCRPRHKPTRDISCHETVPWPLPSKGFFSATNKVPTTTRSAGQESIASSTTTSSSSSSSSSSSDHRRTHQSELQAIAVPHQGRDGGGVAVVARTEQRFEETTLRSAVKALVWRLVAGSVTFATSYSFSKSMTEALAIVSSDFLSKAITMFIGERLMNKSHAGRKSGSDGRGRSLAKALIWRLFAIVNTLTVAVFVSKDLSIASKIAGSDALFKTTLMFAYERGWAKIPWGKVEV